MAWTIYRARDDELDKIENIKVKKGVKELHSMLLEKDPIYAKQINELDEQRIIRALEVIEDREIL